MLFDEIVKEIKEKRENKEKGHFNGIPFPIEKYRDYIPTIDKGMYFGILASSGVGKSRFVRHIMYNVLEFSFENNYPIKIILFALEDHKKQVYKKIICHYLYVRHNVSLHPSQLDSKYNPIDNRYIELLERDKDFFTKLEDSLLIINDALTPSQIESACTTINDRYGYTHHIIAIIDNFSNILKERHHESEWDAIRDLSRNKIRLNLCLKLGISVIGVLQADIESDKYAARNAEKGGISSLEPNTGSISGVKVIVKDFFYLLALFNPWKYEIKVYPYAEGYRTDILRGRFRSLLMIKNNEGEEAPRLGLMFDGKHEIFSELPATTEKDRLEVIYQRVLKEEREKKEQRLNISLFKS